MYLTRGLLNSVSRDVLRDLADPVALHRSLLRLFPDGLGTAPRESVKLLHRVEVGRDGGALLVLQSAVAPDFTKLPADYLVDVDDDRLFSLGWETNPRIDNRDFGTVQPGARFAFRLRANVTKKVGTKSTADGVRRNGKRLPLLDDNARLEWLARKGREGGFRVLDVRVQVEDVQQGRRQGAQVTLASVRYDGLLVVEEPTAFALTLERGIGPAKAYGFGLLSIRPVS